MPSPDGPIGRPTLLLRLYRLLTPLILPFAFRASSKKLRAQGVALPRIREKAGYASSPCPLGSLIWFHAASVGESLSLLSLITGLGARLPTHQFLITSGTATSATLIARRLPPRTRHQFAPLDAPGPVRRFLRHWQPAAGIFVESELWPVMLGQAHQTGMGMVLLNARLSPRSVRRWGKAQKTARYLLGLFRLLLTQNRETADNLLALGADPSRIEVGHNLKSTAAALPMDQDVLAGIKRSLNGRPVWVASSTHPGEEEVILQAHRALLTQMPDLALLLVPRHPERGMQLGAMIEGLGFSVSMRSKGENLSAQTQVYLADTLGETGTWYALAPFVFLGGSLEPIGGHNPFEVALAGAAVITGPHVFNFSEDFAPLVSNGAAKTVTTHDQLAETVALWLSDANALDDAQVAACEFAQSRNAGLDHIIHRLCAVLALDHPDG